jgi:hypothetical protein
MDASDREVAKLDASSIVGLDAYSNDNQFIGRVSGYLPAVAVSEEAIVGGHVDPLRPDGQPVGPRHLVINGNGTIIQSTIIVTMEALDVDLPGRRVTLPLTIAEIEAMPHHDPNEPSDSSARGE